MAHLIRPFINAGDSPFAQEMYQSTRHSFEFTSDAFSPFGYPKHAFNDFYLRDYLNLTVCLMRWGSETDTSLFIDSLGNLDKFNTFRFAFPIRRHVGGYRSRTETLFILLRPEILSLP